MNGVDLLAGMSYMEDNLVHQADTKSIKKPTVRFVVPIAASFVIAVACLFMWTGDSPYSLYFNPVGGQTAQSVYIEGHFWEELSSTQIEALIPKLDEKYKINGTVNYSHSAGTTSIFSVDAQIDVDGKEVKLVIAPNQITKCYQITGQPVLSEIAGVPVEAGLFVTDKNSKGEHTYIYYADFKRSEIAYYVEYGGAKTDEEFFTGVVADIISAGEADLSVLDNPTIPELRDDRLTEKEAYAETTFGAYLPQVPRDYVFNEAVRFINQSQNYLFASWSKGYNDISITISNLKDQDKTRIVTLQQKELYDMSLYPIPWADSMPSDRREIIENPIFKREELTLDAIKMRSYVRGEQGDPSGTSNCMRFCVLYKDVLVEISTEAVSPEYLFDALSKL